MAAFEAATAKAQAESAAQQKKDEAEAEAARIAREAAAKAAREADEKEHQEELAERRKRDAEMKAKHEEELEKRKAEFEKMFRNVWAVGEIGLSQCSMTLPDVDTANKVVGELFKDTLIADAVVTPKVTYEFKNETHLHEAYTGVHSRSGQATI